jgi:hypothetical protein
MSRTDTKEWATEKPSKGLAKRVMRSLTKRLTRRIFLPGDSLGDAVKRVSAFVLGWGSFIALLTWGGYRQGYLHGVGDGFAFFGVLFVLGVIVAPGFIRSGGPQGRNEY